MDAVYELSKHNGVPDDHERVRLLDQLYMLAAPEEHGAVLAALSEKDSITCIVYIMHCLGYECDGTVAQSAGALLELITRNPESALVARTAGAVPPLATAIRARQPSMHQACRVLASMALAGRLNAKVLEHAEVHFTAASLAREEGATPLGVAALWLVCAISRMSERPLYVLQQSCAANDAATIFAQLLHLQENDVVQKAAKCLKEMLSVPLHLLHEEEVSVKQARQLLRSVIQQLARFEAFSFLSASQGRTRASEPLSKTLIFLEGSDDNASDAIPQAPLSNVTDFAFQTANEDEHLLQFLQQCALARSSNKIARQLCIGRNTRDLIENVLINLRHHVIVQKCDSFIRSLAVVRAVGALLDLVLQWRPQLNTSDEETDDRVISPEGVLVRTCSVLPTVEESDRLYAERVEQKLHAICMSNDDGFEPLERDTKICEIADSLEHTITTLIQILWGVDSVRNDQLHDYFTFLQHIFTKVSEAVGEEVIFVSLRECIVETLRGLEQTYGQDQAHSSSKLLA